VRDADRSIVFGCYGVPGNGGGSTATYALVEMMQAQELQASLVNLVDEEDLDYFRYAMGEDYGNPRSLAGIRTCRLAGSLNDSRPELAELLEDLSPDVMVAVGDIAARLMRRARPRGKLVFLTSGCQQMRSAIYRGDVRDFLEQEARILRERQGTNGGPQPRLLHRREREAVEGSDLVIAHCDMTLFLYRYFFPLLAHKLYANVVWFAEWICRDALAYRHLARPFDERDIGVLFLANSWDRRGKNYDFVKHLAASACGWSVHVAGEVRERVRDVTYHGLVLDRAELFGIMGRARAVACPSLYDTAPGILFEASVMGCNVVASRNCGNWRICNPELLVDPFSAEGFARKVAVAQTCKLDDNLSFFLESQSYGDLVETLAVL
jgi:glycosyltransferase involved in cell wall biosynthesis